MDEIESKKGFKCNVCHKTFALKTNLTRHEKIHTGENTFQCDICMKKYTRRDKLINHQKVHTGDLDLQPKVATGERPFQCEVCEKSFSHKHHLKDHMLIHTGVKSFPCDKCNKSFARKQNLDRHLLVHSEVKTYSCTTCGISFTFRGNLMHHKKTCTGQSSSQTSVTSLNSEIQFVDCDGKMIKQEIKQEDELNPLDYVSSEFCENIADSCENSLKSELEAESIDCKETIKLEIKKEMQESEDVRDSMSTVNPNSTDIEEATFTV